MARVDVVIPCYNYGHFLADCIESVLGQEDVEVRALVIDDQSTDNSTEVAHKLADRDCRVQVISLPKNVGMVSAVNRGIGELTGEYFVKLDADDLLSPGALKRATELLGRYPNLGFAYGRPRHFTGVTPPRPRRGNPSWKIWSGAEWIAIRCRLGVNCISQPEAVIRTSALRAAGEYNTRLPHTSDLEMWLRLAAMSDVGRVNGVDHAYYRVHPGSMQRTVNAGLLTDLIGRREAFVSALSAVGRGAPGAAALEVTVRRKLSAEALDRACHAFDRDRLDVIPVDALVEFADATFAGARELPEWSALQRRERRGRRSRWTLFSLAPALFRRTREEIAHAYWRRMGI